MARAARLRWDADNWRLALQGSDTATQDDFRAVLGSLQMKTVPFGRVSHRTISVQPDVRTSVVRAGYYLREVEVAASAPNPILGVDFDKSRVDSGRRFLLTEEHIVVYDPDTQDRDGNVDPSRISFRITGLTGGTLQKLSSDASAVWEDIDLSGTPPNQYREFALADLRAGKMAFLAGDGLTSGDGAKIVFQVQAADDGITGSPGSPSHLSDSDPVLMGDNPAEAEISVIPTAKTIAGETGPINADGILTPDKATLGTWKQDATRHSSTLHVIVKLRNHQAGDALSLQGGYDTSKVTPRWVERGVIHGVR